MDCRVHGIAKSRTQLSDFHFHIHIIIHIQVGLNAMTGSKVALSKAGICVQANVLLRNCLGSLNTRRPVSSDERRKCGLRREAECYGAM